MFSLQAMFGKGDLFYSLLEQSAQAALSSAQALSKLLKSTHLAPSLDEFRTARAQERELFDRIGRALVDTFVLPLEREEIEALSSALYRIPKVIEKFAERYLLAHTLLAQVDFAARAALVEKAAEAVLILIRALPKMNIEAAKSQIDKIRALESEADRLILDDYRDIYTGRYQTLAAFALKDLYELLERAIDRCRDAGNIAYHVVLKNA